MAAVSAGLHSHCMVYTDMNMGFFIPLRFPQVKIFNKEYLHKGSSHCLHYMFVFCRVPGRVREANVGMSARVGVSTLSKPPHLESL